MKRSGRGGDIRIVFPREAMESVFDECDQFDEDETGGRVIGTYVEHDGQLTIEVKGVIGPGPGARRSAVSFFQDGKYQEGVFRKIEERHPEIEHLGNWHTHHVNGLPRLSEGDVSTYKRTVNHRNHNTPFFYALLVVAKNGARAHQERYAVKHYLFRRHDDEMYEIPPSKIDIVEKPVVWSGSSEAQHRPERIEREKAPHDARPDRVYDRDILGDCFPGLRPFSSQRLGVYWRGPIELVDGSNVEIVVHENESDSAFRHSVVVRTPPRLLRASAESLASLEFRSARAAAMATERECNRALYKAVQVPSGEGADTERGS